MTHPAPHTVLSNQMLSSCQPAQKREIWNETPVLINWIHWDFRLQNQNNLNKYKYIMQQELLCTVYANSHSFKYQ